MCPVPDTSAKQMVPLVELQFSICVSSAATAERRNAMSRRPPTTYLTADELKQIAAIKFGEAVSTAPAADQQKALKSAQKNLAKTPEPPTVPDR